MDVPGTLFKEGRTVLESDNMVKHVMEALTTPFPAQARRGGSALAQDTVTAVQHCVSLGRKLASFRDSQQALLRSVIEILRPVNSMLVASPRRPDHARLITRQTNFALWAAVADAMEWPDVDIAKLMIEGFPIVGEIPDSGLYRRIIPVCPLGEFDEQCQAIMATNGEWILEVNRMLKTRGVCATGTALEGLRELERLTLEEVNACLTGPTMGIQRMIALYGKHLRVMPRFGIWQLVTKMRAIDDAKQSLTNAMTRLYETVVLPTCKFPARVAACVVQSCRKQGVPVPAMVVGLDDIDAAYRHIPNAHPGYAVFALWSPKHRKVHYHAVHCHNFGLTSSVVNFNRAPHLVCSFCRRFFALPLEHYVNDFILPNVVRAASTGQQCLAELCQHLGLPLSQRKHQAAAPVNTVLGVRCDMSAVASAYPRVSYSPVPKQCLECLHMLRECATGGDLDATGRPVGFLPAGTAAKLFGKLGWLSTALFGRIGRAACLPLLTRQYCNPPSTTTFTSALWLMKEFFEAVLAPGILPSRVVALNEVGAPPALLYSDASGGSEGLGRLAGVCVDPVTGTREHASCECPQWLFQELCAEASRPQDPGAREYTRPGARPSDKRICQLEGAAAVATLLSFGPSLVGRRVAHFIDNTSALSALVHGYSSKPDMAQLTNLYNLLRAKYDIDVWREYVASAANIADLPTRLDKDWSPLAHLNITPRPLVLPTMSQWLLLATVL